MTEMICHRCGKTIADKEDEERYKVAVSAEDSSAQENFERIFCMCEPPADNPFTSRPQPPNLDDIERRWK